MLQFGLLHVLLIEVGVGDAGVVVGDDYFSFVARVVVVVTHIVGIDDFKVVAILIVGAFVVKSDAHAHVDEFVVSNLNFKSDFENLSGAKRPLVGLLSKDLASPNAISLCEIYS